MRGLALVNVFGKTFTTQHQSFRIVNRTRPLSKNAAENLGGIGE